MLSPNFFRIYDDTFHPFPLLQTNLYASIEQKHKGFSKETNILQLKVKNTIAQINPYLNSNQRPIWREGPTKRGGVGDQN